MFVIFLATTILLSVSRWDIAAHGANNVSQIGHKMTIEMNLWHHPILV